MIQTGSSFQLLKGSFSKKSETHSNLIAVCSTLRTRKILNRLNGAVELAISRRKAEVMACIKDLILRNIQAIESNFLMIEEEDEMSLGFTGKGGDEETLEVGLQRRIEQEVIKRDYYMERIAKFKDWTETVLVNIDSIMRTMGKDVFPDQVVLGKHLDSERFAQPSTDSKILAHFRAESFNLGDSLGGEVFGRRMPNAKKRNSELLSYDRDPKHTFGKERTGQFKSSQGYGKVENDFDLRAQLRRGYSKGSQRKNRGDQGDSFEI